MTKEMMDHIEEFSKTYNLNVYKRVSCGVGAVLHKRPHNPYEYAQSLLNCDSCNIRLLCGPKEIDEGYVLKQIECLNRIGFKLSLSNPKNPKPCKVTPDKRERCPSCCTACYIMDVPKIMIHNKDITLADTAFVRFFTKMIATQQGIEDLGGDTAIVKTLLNIAEVHLVNSWWVMAREQKNCYGCKYCITNAYTLTEREYGLHPMELLRRVENVF